MYEINNKHTTENILFALPNVCSLFNIFVSIFNSRNLLNCQDV